MPPTTVTFGDNEATNVTFNSETEIVATTPPGVEPGSVDVSITTSEGSDSLPEAFEYTDGA